MLGIWRHQQRLDRLFDLGMTIDDLELQSHWSRYLCVLVSGYVEASVAEIYIDLAKRRSIPAVASYVTAQLDRFQNPNMERILTLIASFDPTVRVTVEEQTTGELKDAIDSIVANRNQISHGRDVGISFGRITEYYTKAKKVIELIESSCPA